MTNELTQDAEESVSTEKTAIENAATPDTMTVEAVATAPQAAAATSEASESEPASEETSASPKEAVSDSSQPSERPPAVEAPVSAPAVDLETTEEPGTAGDIDFGAILEQFEQEQTVFHSGELVEGKIVGITDRGVLVDFGYKSEGFVPVEEFTGPEGEMTANVGDQVEVIIRSIHSGDGAPLLSRIDALGRKIWDEIEAAYNSETPIIGRVVDKTKGGLKIDIKGVEAFLPGSQIDSRPIRSLDTYIGEDIEARVIKFSRRRNNIVLSRKVITDVIVNEKKAETLGSIEVGYIVSGTIKNLTEYGAFVDIGGIDGLLHVTDMSWGRIHHPSDQFKVGEQLQVKVLKLDREKEKVSLGYKQLLPDPWSTVVEVYPVNTKITGTVSSVTEYGVFVELEPGVEGLVHVSEISWSRRAQSPKRMFNKGQQVEVQVLGVDTVEKRISLGMKQFQENPWDMVDLKYPVGTKITGRVRNLTDFGAFVELEEGIDGLVHVSDISWAKKIKHPKDVLKKDQEVEAIVTSIDKRGQRLSLSMKDLTPSAWEGFVATHRPGDVVKGKVSRFTNFGVFVELGEGLEGLCHISELSDERVDTPESVAKLGEVMDFKILRIEPVDQKIGLSHRAVGKDDEPVVDTRIYSTEAKGGMASLGELANLKFGESEPEPEAAPDPEEKKRAKQAAKEAKAKEFAAKEAAAAEAANAEPEVAETSTTAAETPAPETETEGSAVAADEAAATEEVVADIPAAETPAEVEPVPDSAATVEVSAESEPGQPGLETEPAPAEAEPVSEAEAAQESPSAEAVPIETEEASPEQTSSEMSEAAAEKDGDAGPEQTTAATEVDDVTAETDGETPVAAGGDAEAAGDQGETAASEKTSA